MQGLVGGLALCPPAMGGPGPSGSPHFGASPLLSKCVGQAAPLALATSAQGSTECHLVLNSTSKSSPEGSGSCKALQAGLGEAVQGGGKHG